MVNQGNTALQVLGLAEDAQLVARLRGGFAGVSPGVSPGVSHGVSPVVSHGPRHVLAQGTHAAEALRLALEGDVASVVLLAPPPVETLEAALAGQLRSLQVPVLALLGTDTPSTMEQAGPWRRAAPKAFVTFVFGAGEAMAAERPQAVATLAADFYARGENFLVKATEDRLYP